MVKRACSQEHNLKTLYPRHHIKLNMHYIVIYDIKKSFFCIVFVINVMSNARPPEISTQDVYIHIYI